MVNVPNLLIMLVHELAHAHDDITGASIAEQAFLDFEYTATAMENVFRWLFFTKVDNKMAPRPAYGMSDVDPDNYPDADKSGNHPDISWDQYWGTGEYASKGRWVLLP